MRAECEKRVAMGNDITDAATTLGRVTPLPADPAAEPAAPGPMSDPTATGPAATEPARLDEILHALAGVDGIITAPQARLADLTTLRIGGHPRALLECSTAEAVITAVRALDAARVPVLVLGGGSNLVVAGGELDLVVVAVRNSEVSYLDADAAAADARRCAGS